MRSADASRIMDEPGLDSSAGQDLTLAEILAQSREQLQQEWMVGVFLKRFKSEAELVRALERRRG